MGLNELYKKYPSLFQFLAEEFENTEVKPREVQRAEFSRFNSKLHCSHPFYKPISKIIELDALENGI